MSLLRRSLLLVALSVPALSLTAPAFAQAPAAAASTPTSFLETKHKSLRALLATPATPERDKKIDAEMGVLVDYDEMAKTALGDEYGKRKKEEIAEFTSILRQLIERNYKKRLNDTLDYQLTYKGEEPKGSDTLVKTEAKNLKNKHEAPVLIDYVVRKKGTTWIVVDLIPEGSSMAKTYNKEFTKVIKKDGWEALIKKMKDKLAKT